MALALADSEITLKLLINARSKKVICGEAGKEFMDFMFSLLTLPLTSVVKFLSPSTTLASIVNLHKSVENLRKSYLHAHRVGVVFFVQGVVSYMIADDLEVEPWSANSRINFIKSLGLKKDIQLEEKVVAIGIKEGLALLEASLVSFTVLTDVFGSCIKKKRLTSYT